MLDRESKLPEIGQECIVACYDPDETRPESVRYRIKTMRFWGASIANTVQGPRWQFRWGLSPNANTWLWVTHWMPVAELPPKSEMESIAKKQICINSVVSEKFPITSESKAEYLGYGQDLLDAVINLIYKHG